MAAYQEHGEEDYLENWGNDRFLAKSHPKCRDLGSPVPAALKMCLHFHPFEMPECPALLRNQDMRLNGMDD